MCAHSQILYALRKVLLRIRETTLVLRPALWWPSCSLALLPRRDTTCREPPAECCTSPGGKESRRAPRVACAPALAGAAPLGEWLRPLPALADGATGSAARALRRLPRSGVSELLLAHGPPWASVTFGEAAAVSTAGEIP